MPAKNYNQVREEFLKFKSMFPDSPSEITDFAKSLDASEGVQDRAAAYTTGPIKQLDATIDRGLDYTHLPEASGAVLGWLGKQGDQVFDTGTRIEDTSRSVGEGLPRMLAEVGLAGIAPEAEIPLLAKRVAQVAGYGSSFLKGTAETDSLAGGAISAGSLGVMNKYLPKIGKATNEKVAELLGHKAGYQVGRGIPEAAQFTAEMAAGSGLGEATRQASMSVGPNAVGPLDPARNPLTVENIAGNVASTLAFAPKAAWDVYKAPALNRGFVKDTIEQMNFDLEEKAAHKEKLDSLPKTRDAQMFLNLLETLDNAKANGLPKEHIDNIKAAMTEAWTGLGRKDPMPAQVEAQVEATGDASRSPVLGEPKAFDAFISHVYHLIDTWNDVKPDDRLPEFGRNRKKQEGNQSWHEDATSSINVKDLQKKQLLPQITPEFLQETFNFVADRAIGNEQEFRVVAQKTANLLLDNTQLALKRRGELYKADSPLSPAVTSDNFENRLMIERLDELPDFDVKLMTTDKEGNALEIKVPFKKAVALRFNEIANMDDLDIKGRPHHPMRSFREGIIQAAASYDPETQTFVYRKPKVILKADGSYSVARDVATDKTLLDSQVFHLSDLLKDTYVDKNGVQRKSPFLTPVVKLAGEGGISGKEKVRTTPNEEGVVLIGDKEASGAVAETPYDPENPLMFSETAEGKSLTDITRESPVTALERLSKEYDAASDMSSNEPSTENDPAKNTTSAVGALASDLKRTIEDIHPDELWKKVKDMYVTKTSTGFRTDAKTTFRQENMKLALQAGLESFGRGTGRGGGDLGPKAIEFVEANRRKGYKFDSSSPYREFAGLLKDFFYKQGAGIPEIGRGNLNDSMIEVIRRVIGDEAIKPLMVKPEKSVPMGFNADTPAQTIPRVAKLQPGREVKTEYGSEDDNVRIIDPSNVEGKVTSLLLDRAKHVFGTYGYSGWSKDQYANIAVALTKAQLQAQGNPSVTIHKLVDPSATGRATYDYDKQSASVGARGGEWKPNSENQAHGMMLDHIRTILHEVTHIDQFIMEGKLDRPDAYSEQRYKQLKNLYNAAGLLTPEERSDILKVFAKSFLPKELYDTNVRYEPTDYALKGDKALLYGSYKINEFVSEINSFMSLAVSGGKPGQIKQVENVLKFSPLEISEYARYTFRTVADIMNASAELYKHPEIVKAAGITLASSAHNQLYYGSQMYKSTILAAETLAKLSGFDEVNRQLRDHTSALASGGLMHTPVPPGVWQFGEFHKPQPPQFDAPASQAAPKAVGEAHKVMFGDKTEQGTKAGWLTRLIYPFTNYMEKMERAGIPTARSFLYLANDVAPSIARMHTAMMEPFLARGKDGRMVYDENNPLIRMNKSEPNGLWRVRMNDALRWQNASEKMMFETVNGVLQPTKEATTAWARISKNLPKDKVQGVMASVDALMKSMAKSRDLIDQTLVNSTRNLTAKVLMGIDRNMTYDAASDRAATILDAFLQGKQNELGLPPKVLETLQDHLIGVADENGKLDGAIPRHQALMDHLNSRPFFSSEALVGDYIVKFKTPDNDIKYLSGKTESSAKALAQKLIGEHNTVLDMFDKKDVQKYSEFDNPADVLSKFSEVEQQKWQRFLKNLEGHYDPTVIQELREGFVPGAASAKEMEGKGLKSFMQKREGKVDVSRLDYIEASLEGYAPRLAASLAHRSVREQFDLIMRDPRNKPYHTFRTDVKDHFDHMFSKTEQWTREAKAAISAYYLGANLSSAVIELTQSPISTIPWIISEMKSGGAAQAYKVLINAGMRMFDYGTDSKWLKTAQDASAVLPKNWTKDQAMAWVYQEAIRDGTVTHGAISEITDTVGHDQNILAARKFGSGDYSDTSKATLMRNKLYLAGQTMLKLYSWASLANTKVSILSGAEIGFEQGLRGKELYDYARKFKNLTTMGGGKANAPGYLPKVSTDATRSAWGMMNTLQQYGLGTVAMYSELGQRSIRDSKLTPAEKAQSRKALGTLLISQVAIGGALSAPFAGAAIALLEKQFGIQADEAVRSALASLGGDDEELGSLISNVAMSGFVNQATGMDISTRVGVNGIFGVSAYQGFNMADVLGPTGGIIKNLSTALNEFGNNNPTQAVKALVPAAFKQGVELYANYGKYGDNGVRDKSANLIYNPTDAEVAGMSIGFKPSGLSRRMLAGRMKKLSDDNFQMRQDKEYDKAALDLLQGGGQLANQMAMETFRTDPSGRGRLELLRGVMERAQNMVTEKDLLASGPVGNAEGQRNIATVLGRDAVPRRSEVEMMRLRAQLAQKLGAPELMQSASMGRAGMLDQMMVGQDGESGRTRAEALRLAQFLGQ